MRNIHQRLLKKQARFWLNDVRPPRTTLPSQRRKILLRILPTQRKLQPTLAIRIPMTGPLITASLGQDGHDLVPERGSSNRSRSFAVISGARRKSGDDDCRQTCKERQRSGKEFRHVWREFEVGIWWDLGGSTSLSDFRRSGARELLKQGVRQLERPRRIDARISQPLAGVEVKTDVYVAGHLDGRLMES